MGEQEMVPLPHVPQYAKLLRENALLREMNAAIRASYADFQSTGDVHELARAVGNILDAGGDEEHLDDRR